MFGWSAVSSEPMTWADFALARQQQVEERIGTRIREERAREDAIARKTGETLARIEHRTNGHHTPAVIPPRPITDEILG